MKTLFFFQRNLLISMSRGIFSETLGFRFIFLLLLLKFKLKKKCLFLLDYFFSTEYFLFLWKGRRGILSQPHLRTKNWIRYVVKIWKWNYRNSFKYCWKETILFFFLYRSEIIYAFVYLYTIVGWFLQDCN